MVRGSWNSLSVTQGVFLSDVATESVMGVCARKESYMYVHMGPKSLKYRCTISHDPDGIYQSKMPDYVHLQTQKGSRLSRISNRNTHGGGPLRKS